MQIFRRKPEAPHSASPLAGFSFAGDAVLSILHWVAGSQPALTTALFGPFPSEKLNVARCGNRGAELREQRE